MTETVGCKRGGEIISSQKEKERERGDFCPEFFKKKVYFLAAFSVKMVWL